MKIGEFLMKKRQDEKSHGRSIFLVFSRVVTL